MHESAGNEQQAAASAAVFHLLPSECCISIAAAACCSVMTKVIISTMMPGASTPATRPSGVLANEVGSDDGYEYDWGGGVGPRVQ